MCPAKALRHPGSARSDWTFVVESVDSLLGRGGIGRRLAWLSLVKILTAAKTLEFRERVAYPLASPFRWIGRIST